MDEPHALSLAFRACSVAVEVSLAHLLSVHSRPQSLRSFWPAAGIESSASNHFEITKEITEFCPSGFTQPLSMAHARNGCSQSSRFLPQVRRIVGSGDENAVSHNSYTWLGRPEGNNHSCPLLPPSLSCAGNEQSN